MENKIEKFIFWTPRILSIILLAFLTLFSLDVFGNGYSFWETLVGLFMHNIPVFILLAILLVAWRYEIVGAIFFVLAGILYAVLVFNNVDDWKMALAWSAQISGTAFIIGIFFWINWIKKIKK